MCQPPSFHPYTSSYQILSRPNIALAPLALSFTLISHSSPYISSHCEQHLAPRIASYARLLKRLVLTYNALHATTSPSLYNVLEGRLIAFVRASNRTALLRFTPLESLTCLTYQKATTQHASKRHIWYQHRKISIPGRSHGFLNQRIPRTSKGL